MPIEAQIGGDFLHGRSATLLSDVPGESLRVMGIRAQPVEALLLHAASWATRDASQVEGEIDAQVTARQIAYATRRRSYHVRDGVPHAPQIVCLPVESASRPGRSDRHRSW